MSDKDENSVLDGTVDEVKEAVKNLDDPDYEDLLKQEEEGKDRKTVKDFLKRKAGISDAEKEQKDDSESDKEETTTEKPASSLTSDSSAVPLAAAGVVIGLLIGLAAGQMVGGGVSGNPDVASNNVEAIIASGGFNGTVDVGSPQTRHGMYYFNVSITQQTPNGTSTSFQPAYVSKDGELLFPVVRSFMLTSPINMPETISRQQNATN